MENICPGTNLIETLLWVLLSGVWYMSTVHKHGNDWNTLFAFHKRWKYDNNYHGTRVFESEMCFVTIRLKTGSFPGKRGAWEPTIFSKTRWTIKHSKRCRTFIFIKIINNLILHYLQKTWVMFIYVFHGSQTITLLSTNEFYNKY